MKKKCTFVQNLTHFLFPTPTNHSHRTTFVFKIIRQKLCKESTQPSSTRPRPENRIITANRTRVRPMIRATNTPRTLTEPMGAAQKLFINLVKNHIILRKFPSKRGAAIDHFFEVFDGQIARVLFRRIIPRDVMKIVAYRGACELFCVAYNCVKIPFWR
ncbi:hypothetical protein Hanom_Chr16g01463161 [Helianthus anomalus]